MPKIPQKTANPRAIASKILLDVIIARRSLATVLPLWLKDQEHRNLTQELSYGVLRWYPRLEAAAKVLLQKPLKPQDQDIYFLLLLGLYQLIYLNMPEHIVVSETVNAAKILHKTWATKLINGVLRSFLRQKEEILLKIDTTPSARYAHPRWMIKQLQQAWPNEWQTILIANNERPPMSLRVNLNKIAREQYLEKLSGLGLNATPDQHSPCGIVLEKPANITQLPGFKEGEASVQDCASQLAATLLQLKPGQRVLDACAAPGGKAAHILEIAPQISQLVALDIDTIRLEKITENLMRLGLTAHTVVGDAAQPETWWDGVLFDRILLDAPCSATGVIRRHADIKLLRQPHDIEQLAQMQLKILSALWPLLKTRGILVYSTCSIFPQENQRVLTAFLETQADAQESKIDVPWGHALEIGRQILPGEDNMDGFYYARLFKLSC